MLSMGGKTFIEQRLTALCPIAAHGHEYEKNFIFASRDSNALALEFAKRRGLPAREIALTRTLRRQRARVLPRQLSRTSGLHLVSAQPTGHKGN